MNRYYTYIKSRKSTGKAWGQGEKEVTENEMVWWHRQLNGHEFAQTPEDSEGQESLVGCSPWHCKELDTNWWLKNNNEEIHTIFKIPYNVQHWLWGRTDIYLNVYYVSCWVLSILPSFIFIIACQSRHNHLIFQKKKHEFRGWGYTFKKHLTLMLPFLHWKTIICREKYSEWENPWRKRWRSLWLRVKSNPPHAKLYWSQNTKSHSIPFMVPEASL